jgi:hypothetical protein
MRDGPALDDEPVAEFGTADEDVPQVALPEVQVVLRVVGVLVAVDQ